MIFIICPFQFVNEDIWYVNPDGLQPLGVYLLRNERRKDGFSVIKSLICYVLVYNSENSLYFSKLFHIFAIRNNLMNIMTFKKSLYSSVPCSRLKSLAKSVRDYSKPTLGEVVQKARESLNEAKPSNWIKIISTPMGGMRKK